MSQTPCVPTERDLPPRKRDRETLHALLSGPEIKDRLFLNIPCKSEKVLHLFEDEQEILPERVQYQPFVSCSEVYTSRFLAQVETCLAGGWCHPWPSRSGQTRRGLQGSGGLPG